MQFWRSSNWSASQHMVWASFGCRQARVMPLPTIKPLLSGGPWSTEHTGELGFLVLQQWVVHCIRKSIRIKTAVCPLQEFSSKPFQHQLDPEGDSDKFCLTLTPWAFHCFASSPHDVVDTTLTFFFFAHTTGNRPNMENGWKWWRWTPKNQNQLMLTAQDKHADHASNKSNKRLNLPSTHLTHK